MERNQFEVNALEMPHPERPEINSWVSYLEEHVNNIDEENYFVGHSIGCQAIMRFLEKLDIKVEGVVFVAGFFNLPYLDDNEEKKIAKPWLETTIDSDKVKLRSKKIIAIFSDNDPDVSMDESKLFKEKLNAKIVVEYGKGHFTNDDGVKELP